jgi:hypothetical protein
MLFKAKQSRSKHASQRQSIFSKRTPFFKAAPTLSIQRSPGYENETPLSNKAALKNYDYISSLDNKGNFLSKEEESFFSPRFGHDFSNVRIHTDARANESAKSLNAHAYTYKNNIVFANNQYQPKANAGKKLLAHELTHVVQQKSAQKKPMIARNAAVGILGPMWGVAAAEPTPIGEIIAGTVTIGLAEYYKYEQLKKQLEAIKQKALAAARATPILLPYYPIFWPLSLGPPLQKYFTRTISERDEDVAKQGRMQLLWRSFRDPSFDPTRFHIHHVNPLFLGGLDNLTSNGTLIEKGMHLRGHESLRFQPHLPFLPKPIIPAPPDLYSHPAGLKYVVIGFK